MNKKNFKILFNVLFIILLGAIIFYGIYIYFQNTLYKNTLDLIKNRNWIEAKTNIDSLGDYKNSKELSKEIYYNYYVTFGDENFNKKNYESALLMYNRAKNYQSIDESINKKIALSEAEIKKIKVEEEKKLEQEKKITQQQQEKKLEQEKKKLEQEKKIARQQRDKEISELQNLVNRAFTNVSIQDFGGEIGGVYEFYTYPEAWFSLSYSEKRNILLSCRKYIELTQNVSEKKAQVGVRIKSAYDGASLATATNIK